MISPYYSSYLGSRSDSGSSYNPWGGVTLNQFKNKQAQSQVQGLLSGMPQTNSPFSAEFFAQAYDAQALTPQVIQRYQDKVNNQEQQTTPEKPQPEASPRVYRGIVSEIFDKYA